MINTTEIINNTVNVSGALVELNSTIDTSFLGVCVTVILSSLTYLWPCLNLNAKYKKLQNKNNGRGFLKGVKKRILEKSSFFMEAALFFMWATFILVAIITYNLFMDTINFQKNYMDYFGWFVLCLLLGIFCIVQAYLKYPEVETISNYETFEQFHNITQQQVKDLTHINEYWIKIKDADLRETIIDAISGKIIENSKENKKINFT